jgi:hypothetical protein
MIEPELILSGTMDRTGDLIGGHHQFDSKQGISGMLSCVVSAKETRVIFPDNFCFVGTLPNQHFFHSMLMIRGAEWGFYIITPDMLPVIRIVPTDEMFEFLLVLDDIAQCWKAGFNPIGSSDATLEPYHLVEMKNIPKHLTGPLCIIPSEA